MDGRVTASQMAAASGGIAFGSFDVALHVARRHYPDGMSEIGQLACPMMRRAAGFHADQAGRNLAEELEHLLAAQLPVDDDLAIAIGAMDLEDILGEIDADGANLHVEAPLR